MESLPLLPSDNEASANCISADGTIVVGTSGRRAVGWFSIGNVFPLQTGVYGSDAEAIDDKQAERKENALTQVRHIEHVANGGEKLFHDL